MAACTGDLDGLVDRYSRRRQVTDVEQALGEIAGGDASRGPQLVVGQQFERPAIESDGAWQIPPPLISDVGPSCGHKTRDVGELLIFYRSDRVGRRGLSNTFIAEAQPLLYVPQSRLCIIPLVAAHKHNYGVSQVEARPGADNFLGKRLKQPL